MTWQGWVVILLWFAIVIAAIPMIDPRRHPIAYLAVLLVMSLLLILICYAKGEPPRWRWGDGDD